MTKKKEPKKEQAKEQAEVKDAEPETKTTEQVEVETAQDAEQSDPGLASLNALATAFYEEEEAELEAFRMQEAEGDPDSEPGLQEGVEFEPDETALKVYICHTKCYWKDRLWYPGDTLAVSPDKASEVPRHFKPLVPVLPRSNIDLEDRAFLRDALRKMGIPFGDGWPITKLRTVYMDTVQPGRLKEAETYQEMQKRLKKSPFATE